MKYDSCFGSQIKTDKQNQALLNYMWIVRIKPGIECKYYVRNADKIDAFQGVCPL